MAGEFVLPIFYGVDGLGTIDSLLMWCTVWHMGIYFGYYKQEGSVVDPAPDPSINKQKK
jgi:hypothetical protein